MILKEATSTADAAASDLGEARSNAVVGRIRQASRTGDSGELVLRRGTLTGRVFLVGGAVAWAHCVGVPRYLLDELVQRCQLDAGDLRQLLTDCRAEGRQFGDYLVDLGVVDEAAVGNALSAHFRSQMAALAGQPGPLRSMFVPQAQSFGSRFIFSVHELWPPLEDPERLSGVVPRVGRLTDLVDAAMALDGAQCCAVVDTLSGEAILRRASITTRHARASEETVVALARAASAMLRADGDDEVSGEVMVTGTHLHHLMVALPGQCHLLHLAVERPLSNLALTRLRLKELVAAH